jgi:hypothetical protein
MQIRRQFEHLSEIFPAETDLSNRPQFLSSSSPIKLNATSSASFYKIASPPLMLNDTFDMTPGKHLSLFLVSDPLCLFSSLALHFFPIFLFGSIALLTGMAGISLHMQLPLTSQWHGSKVHKHYSCVQGKPGKQSV